MSSTIRPAGQHAVVIGASVAGLLAGRVLADHFERVTIVERDGLPAGPDVRKSVPQGRHIHVLLARGSRLLERFFPGLSDELTADGATPLDWAADVRWYNFGGWKPSFPSGLISSVGSRALIEWGIRRRVAGGAARRACACNPRQPARPVNRTWRWRPTWSSTPPAAIRPRPIGWPGWAIRFLR
jgi:hypothetical protein